MVLRELKSEDAVGMLEWMHDKDIQKKFQFAAADRTMEDVLKFIRLGEESYPQIPPNGECPSPKFQKSEIGNFRK